MFKSPRTIISFLAGAILIAALGVSARAGGTSFISTLSDNTSTQQNMEATSSPSAEQMESPEPSESPEESPSAEAVEPAEAAETPEPAGSPEPDEHSGAMPTPTSEDGDHGDDGGGGGDH
jgi:cytoskeletal protein RodZ